jgi:hypothetical protein
MNRLQLPRIMSVPEAASSRGREAIDFAKKAGLKLDAAQALVLEHALGVKEDGRWAAFGVGVVEPRQNGKGAILEARELAGLFLFRERLIIHSAHQVDTSLEHFRRLLWLIEETPELDRRVAKVRNTNGQEEITLKTGERIRFRSRSRGGGRGFSCDCLVLDEAMFLPEFAYGALLPTLSARPNPQVWHTGSAVDQFVHEHGLVLARVRERGVAGDDPTLAFFEWSVDGENPSLVPAEVAVDERAWRQANPALPKRISLEHVRNEQRSMDPRSFAVERLGIGDWPATDGTASVIDINAWQALTDVESKIVGPVCFTFDVTPDRAFATIAASGRRDDGLLHVEVIERRPGTGWIARRLVDLVARHKAARVSCDAAGPAGSILPALAAANIAVEAVTARDYAAACGLLFDLVEQEAIRHLGSDVVVNALRGASRRPLADAWAWSRKSSAVDISPLVAVTLAAWAASTVETVEAFALTW